MDVTIGSVTLTDARPPQPKEARFPKGPVVEVFARYDFKVGDLLSDKLRTGPASYVDADGLEYRLYYSDGDPAGDAVIGVNPSRIIVHDRAIPQKYLEVLAWRAARAGIEVEFAD